MELRSCPNQAVSSFVGGLCGRSSSSLPPAKPQRGQLPIPPLPHPEWTIDLIARVNLINRPPVQLFLFASSIQLLDEGIVG